MKQLLTIAVLALLGTSCTDHCLPQPEEPELEAPTDTLPAVPEGPEIPIVCPPTEVERVAYFSAAAEKFSGKEVELSQVSNGWRRGVFTAVSSEYKERGFDCEEYEQLYTSLRGETPKPQTSAEGISWSVYYKTTPPYVTGYEYRFYMPADRSYVEIRKYTEERDQDGNLTAESPILLYVIKFDLK